MYIRKIDIGDNIKFYRKNSGLTQAKLGEILGVSYVTISTWESGRTLPSDYYIDGICSALHCKKEDILGADYSGSIQDKQKEQLLSLSDSLNEEDKQLLLIRAKELYNMEKENLALYMTAA